MGRMGHGIFKKLIGALCQSLWNGSQGAKIK